MATKVKISRSFTFKVYRVNGSEEVLNDAHSGEFMLKSECHYYAEKGVLDFIKSDLESVKDDKFTIFKVCTQEDTTVKDVLIELITVKNGEIHID